MKTPSTDVGPSQPKRRASPDEDKRNPYISPLKRVKNATSTKPQRRVYESADELKAFLRSGVDIRANAPTVMLKARVVWTSFDVVRTGPVARIHLTDKRATDSLDEMYEEFRDKYDTNRMEIDQELITASVYGVDKKTKGIPKDGKLVSISRVWALKLFLNECCQLTTSLDAINVLPDTSPLFP